MKKTAWLYVDSFNQYIISPNFYNFLIHQNICKLPNLPTSKSNRFHSPTFPWLSVPRTEKVWGPLATPNVISIEVPWPHLIFCFPSRSHSNVENSELVQAIVGLLDVFLGNVGSKYISGLWESVMEIGKRSAMFEKYKQPMIAYEQLFTLRTNFNRLLNAKMLRHGYESRVILCVCVRAGGVACSSFNYISVATSWM